jgi:hypothetical protein
LTHSTSEVTANAAGAPTTITSSAAGNIISGDGYVMVGITGPAMLGGVEYGLKSIEYCLEDFGAGALVDAVTVNEEGPPQLGVRDATDRTVAGCYSMDVNRSGSHGYSVLWALGGGAGTSLRIAGVTSTWAPAASLPAAVAEASGSPETTGRN